ncbi:MAG TPA: MMPL family transporter [Pirellulales bacterium]|jgi:hypothetical protein
MDQQHKSSEADELLATILPSEVEQAVLRKGRWGRVVIWLVDYRWPLMSLAILAVALAWRPARSLSFDRSVENMFAPDDPILAPYHKLQRTFGGNEVALAVYDDPDLLKPAGLARLERLAGALAKIDGVDTVFSLAQNPLDKMPAFIATPARREAFIELCEGYTISEDRKTAAVVCVLKPERESKLERSETVDQMRSAIDELTPGGQLTGEPVMVVDGFRYLEEDGRRLGIASTILLSLTIIFCFRSLRWVIVPMAIVYSTLIVTEGLLVSSGIRLSMVSSMLWAIVAVIGIATVIHVVISFRELRAAGHTPRAAMIAAGAMLAAPVFWACLTDTSGFGSLITSRVGPVHDFGIMMSVAAVVSLTFIAILLPGLSLLGHFDADPKHAWGESQLTLGLHGLSSLIEHRPKLLAMLVILVTGPPLLGNLFLEVESDFTKNFLPSSPIVHAYNFVETRLGGAGVWDVIIPMPEGSDPNFVDKVRNYQKRLLEEVRVTPMPGETSPPGLTKVMSVVDALDAMFPNSSFDANQLEAVLAPLKIKDNMPIVRLMHGRDPADGNRQFLRIMLRSRERQGSEHKEELIEQVTRISNEEFPGSQTTGFFVLLTRLIESMLGDQWLTFILSTSGIFVMMLIAFRSIPIALITLIPNALPIMVVMGLLGWFGLKMNMGAAMIAAVSMGLAVDSSAHYITAFRMFRADGQSIDQAMRSVHQSVGRAVVFSTLALIVGFTALCLSQFVPTIYFGVLVSMTMVGGMVGNLVVLPLLLKMVLSFERETKPAPPVDALREEPLGGRSSR